MPGSQTLESRFAGGALKDLRRRLGIGQASMAKRLGLSVSYLSQLENDDRPITSKVAAALATAFPLDWRFPVAESPLSRMEDLHEVMRDPLFADLPPVDDLHRLAIRHPALADRIIHLHTAYRRAEEHRQIADEVLTSGASAGRPPWEEVRDWFHDSGNYVDSIDRAAEALAEELGPAPPEEPLLINLLEVEHGLEVVWAQEDQPQQPLRAFDRQRGILVLDRTQPAETRRFLLAQQLGVQAFASEIATISRTAPISEQAQRLLEIGLANYAAGALLMPYQRYRTAARRFRHDIDRLCRHFHVSFEQASHRLSNLQRPDARGLPVFFYRVDMAGNITKRHSATRLQFARFGGACPLWIAHEAVAIPGRVHVQLSETPDGVRYVSMAKGLVKPSGSYSRLTRRYAVALGCEVAHAADFVYADGLDVGRTSAAVPIGISCRLCPRAQCDQRAFPPYDRSILIDPDVRTVVPYQVV